MSRTATEGAPPCSIVLACCVCCALGCDSTTGVGREVLAVAGRAGTAAECRDVGSLSELDPSIVDACRYEGGHLVPDALTGLLEDHIGGLDATSYICQRFCWPLFCWKKASQLNPDLRAEICERFIEDLSDEYPAEQNRDFLEGHRADCLQGVPQFIY